MDVFSLYRLVILCKKSRRTLCDLENCKLNFDEQVLGTKVLPKLLYYRHLLHDTMHTVCIHFS